MTHKDVALKYFDTVLKELTELVTHVDEDCPSEYRSDLLRIKIDEVYDLIEFISQEHLDKQRGDEGTNDQEAQL